MAAKSDAVIKLVLVFVISLLSFAVGTFVGKKYSDQQHKIAAYEPAKEGHGREVASEGDHGHSNKASTMSDEEIARLAEEFVTDDTQNPEANKGHVEAKPHGETAGQAGNDAHEKAATTKAAPALAHEPLKVTQNLVDNKNHHPMPETKAAKTEPRLPAALPKNVAQYPTGKFTVQVASFSAEDDARKRAEELKGRGYSAFYLPAQVNGKTWYRVSVGQFPTEQEAKSYRAEFMEKTKIESAIIQKIIH